MGNNAPAVNDLAWNVFLDGQSPVELRTAYDQLKPTERAFVDEFVASDDPRGAMIRAMAGKPQASRNPDARALEFMRRPLVQAAIAERMQAAMKRLELTADRVLTEVAKIAFANMGEYIRINGEGEPYTDLSGVNADQMAAISEVKTEDFVDGRGEDARDIKKVSIKLHDKMGALDKLMRYFGLFAADNKKSLEVSGVNGMPIQSRQVVVHMSPAEAADIYAQSLIEDQS